MSELEKRVAAIERRNQRVELDKLWETSLTRRLSVSALTYIVVAVYLRVVVHNDRPFINALVPVIGYLVSTVVVRSVRSIWQKSLDNRAER